MKLNRMVKLKERFSNPELVIEGRIFFKGKLVSGSIAIANERIVGIGKSLRGDERVDFGDKIILPGFTDIHVHFREPGMEHKENFETGSRAGLRGGITTYFDMPNTKPPANSFRRIEEKIGFAKKKSFSDFGIYGLVSETTEPNNVANADAYKIFMSASTESEEFRDYSMLKEVLEKFQDKVIAVHPEHKEFIRKITPKTLREHYLARKDAEIEAVKFMAKYNNFRFHFCHISTPEGLDLLENPGKITFESTPHHLLLNLKSGNDARYKVNPPLRTEDEQKKVYQAFLDGKIKILASDHAPHLLEEKENFETAPSGVPGIETMIPLFILLAKHGEIPLETVVTAGAVNPAALFSLKKGEIKEGYFADLTVWDPSEIREIKDKDIWSKCGWSPFSGREAIFPSHVFLRGTMMIEDYEFVGVKKGMHVCELGETKAKI